MGNSISLRNSGDPHSTERSVHKKEHSWRGPKVSNLKVALQEASEYPEEPELENDLNVSFGYHCRTYSRDADDLASGSLSKSFGESSLGGASTPDSFKDSSPVSGPALDGWKGARKTGSFSSLAGAALGANTTLSNTTLAHGTVPNLDSPRTFRKLGSGILSGSSFATSAHSSTSSSSSNPFAFNKTPSSPSPPLPSVLDDGRWPRNRGGPHSSSAPSLAKHSSFLYANDLQMAGGCAGEDRVMAVCSEENGWLFCGVYDGFNGRDAADYLAANLYENICVQLRLLEWRLQHDEVGAEAPVSGGRIWQHTCSDHSPPGGSKDGTAGSADVLVSVDSNLTGPEPERKGEKKGVAERGVTIPPPGRAPFARAATPPRAIGGLPRITEGRRRSISPPWKSTRFTSSFSKSSSRARSPNGRANQFQCEACITAERLRVQGGPDAATASDMEGVPPSEEEYRGGVVKGLMRALAQTETDFMSTVELEMDERPDLVMVGSCVLAVLLQGQHLYALNLGDSRAVLATKGAGGEWSECCEEGCSAVQLTQDHKVADVDERDRLVGEHPDDDTTVWNGRVKGKLAVTRAFGAGYLKKKKMNDALMGILRVSDLESPPYISTAPWVYVHEVKPQDRFVILSSDGLNDFFTNEEAVHEVCRFTQETREGDPAKHLLEQLITRAAKKAGMTVEQLKNVPSGRRRKYHDDITIVIIMLQPGTMKTSSASTLNGHV